MDKNSKEKCLKKTTNIQFDFLIREMSIRPYAARGYGYGTKREIIDADWCEIVDQLNELGPPFRTISEWKKVWTDLRKRLQTRLNNEKHGQNAKRKSLDNKKTECINKTKKPKATTATIMSPAATNEYNERRTGKKRLQFSDNFYVANNLKREESPPDETFDAYYHSSLSKIQQEHEQLTDVTPDIYYDKVFLYKPEHVEIEANDSVKGRYFNNSHNNGYINNKNNNNFDYVHYSENIEQLKQTNKFHQHLTEISATLNTLMERQIQAIEKQNITLERQVVAMERQANALTSLIECLGKKFNNSEPNLNECTINKNSMPQ